MLYREKFGPFNLAYRIELALARGLSVFCKGAKPGDFMIWPIKDPEPESNIAEIIERLGRQNEIIEHRNKGNG